MNITYTSISIDIKFISKNIQEKLPLHSSFSMYRQKLFFSIRSYRKIISELIFILKNYFQTYRHNNVVICGGFWSNFTYHSRDYLIKEMI